MFRTQDEENKEFVLFEHTWIAMSWDNDLWMIKDWFRNV